jgi:dTDP-glucose pyrophosphorylase
MNILLLMAGGDTAFEVAGQPYPKNLVEIEGDPLAQRVIQSLDLLGAAENRLICAIRRDENLRWHTGDVIRLLQPGATVIEVPAETGGAACTALLAIDHIAEDEPLLIYNGDQIIDRPLEPMLDDFLARDLDGGIIVFDGVHPRWSYVRVDDDGLVVEAAEKRPISRLATAGTYWFRRGRDFLDAVAAMIFKDAHVGGSFYVCPAYNELILNRARIGVHAIDREAYYSLATPRGIAVYEEHLVARRTVS